MSNMLGSCLSSLVHWSIGHIRKSISKSFHLWFYSKNKLKRERRKIDNRCWFIYGSTSDWKRSFPIDVLRGEGEGEGLFVFSNGLKQSIGFTTKANRMSKRCTRSSIWSTSQKFPRLWAHETFVNDRIDSFLIFDCFSSISTAQYCVHPLTLFEAMNRNSSRCDSDFLENICMHWLYSFQHINQYSSKIESTEFDDCCSRLHRGSLGHPTQDCQVPFNWLLSNPLPFPPSSTSPCLAPFTQRTTRSFPWSTAYTEPIGSTKIPAGQQSCVKLFPRPLPPATTMPSLALFVHFTTRSLLESET